MFNLVYGFINERIDSQLPLAGGGVNGTVTSAVGANASLSWLGTVRGRIGWLATPTLLLFGSGGVAYGGVNLNVNTFQNANATIQRIPITISPNPAGICQTRSFKAASHSGYRFANPHATHAPATAIGRDPHATHPLC